ncbi:MAG: hypothetical protein Q8R81_12040 [Novosphingobium sp.]|uniref:hypothetical protein n=1 Tax=Novosphingobium sp. TaxID=1874826 RepID=UPI002735B7DF|nr:hypothetical protein [Novosphingobium sp.]MDP3551111.1 hypothetical protein [Novosphingobium sp.]
MNASPVNLAKDPAAWRDVIHLLETAMSVLDNAGYYTASALVSSAIDEVETIIKIAGRIAEIPESDLQT